MMAIGMTYSKVLKEAILSRSVVEAVAFAIKTNAGTAGAHSRITAIALAEWPMTLRLMIIIRLVQHSLSNLRSSRLCADSGASSRRRAVIAVAGALCDDASDTSGEDQTEESGELHVVRRWASRG